MKARIPKNPKDLGGDSVIQDDSCFEVLAKRDRTCLIELNSLDPSIDWFEEFETMYCQLAHDGDTIKVIRKATDEEIKLFRVPVFIQDDEVPDCCGQPMFFVGQIDDDKICTETPEGAKMWWHDGASFYVFTCSQCLGVKAIGQQF